MATALAAQLAQIAANSKSSLDVKAQKAAHSKSLIFEPRVAAVQNFQTLYGICREGFDELCQLDPRFLPFGATIFSEQSQDEDRAQMTAAENAELDKRIDSFLRLAGARLRLMPTIKAIEWLIRRFRIHEYNTTTVISTFLPYHTIPAFVTLLSILPSDLPPVFKFLDPYIKSLVSPPRAVFVHRAIHHLDFLSTLSTYTLETCRAQRHYPALISFWAGIMTEAVNGLLDKMRSGRSAIQKSNDQSLFQLIGPTIRDALVMSKVPGLQIACYMVITVYVAKGDLDDNTITALMEQLVAGWTVESLRPGLICLSVLAQYRSAKQMSGKVTRALLKIQDLPSLLAAIGKEHDLGKLANGLCLALIDRVYKKGDSRGLPLIESLLLASVLSQQQAGVIFKSLLLAAYKVDDQVDEKGEIRKGLASTIIRLSQVESDARDIFTRAINETQVDLDELEMRLDIQIRPQLPPAQPRADIEMEDSTEVQPQAESFEVALVRASKFQTQAGASCLKSSSLDVFGDLCSVYLSSLAEPSNVPMFDQIPSLHREQASKESFYFSFLMRIWCGPYPTLARVGALDMAKNRLKQPDCGDVDYQAIFPYGMVALNDPSKKVRQAAADLIAVIGSFYASSTVPQHRWGQKALYDKTEALEWMSLDTCQNFLGIILLPSLEECVLNADYITEITNSALNSGTKGAAQAAANDKKGRLSHGMRRSVLSFLALHAVYSPLLVVKLRLGTCLNRVKSVSGISRTQLLLPLLEQWTSLSADKATRLCSLEKVEETAVNQSSLEVLLPNEKEGLEFILDAVQTKDLILRHTFLHNIFLRIRDLWPNMKTETKHMVAQRMLELTQQDWSDDRSPASTEAADLLRNVELTTDILLYFLEALEPTTKMADEPPPGKRRRTSSSEAHRGLGTQPTPEISATLKQVTFVLQLVEGSDPEKHPELLNALFNTLSELQHFRVLVGSELGYLQSLVLRSLLAMVPAYKDSSELTIDSTGGHGDLLVNCIQKSSSPAVQSTALLLVASLAKVAPDLVLNSVMPIFTQMGTSVLRQSDDYSAHVINQTVKEVVPPLIQSLRKGKISPLAGSSELLLSFVTAYEHIPSHRRLGLFVSLVETLDAKEFLFALLGMLTNMYGPTDQVLSFSTELFNYFTVEIQLQSLIKLISLVGDIFQPRPTISTVLLGTNDQGERDPEKIGLSELTLLPHLLSSRKLTTQISKLAERDDMEASKVRELYSTLLENLLLLADSLKQQKSLYNCCGDALSKLLNLLSIGEFIKAVETLLDRPDTILRRKVLRAVEVRIDRESQGDGNSRAALLAFLPQLTAIIRVSDDVAYKHIAVSCVDKISEKYGKKDPEAVAAAASTIAGDKCLGQDDLQLRVMALLCLASLVDVLQDGIVPVLPSAIPKALSYISESFTNSARLPELHNAGYAFITAVAQYIPYMLSGSYLGQILAVSSVSAKSRMGGESNDARLQCLQFIAKQVEAKTMFTALDKGLSTYAEAGHTAMREYLNVLGIAIDKHSKMDISKNVTILASIFLNALDLRRMLHSQNNATGEFRRHIGQVEAIVNDVALRMVYKLNDAAFRPIFSQLMEWSTTLSKKETAGKNLRLLSVYGFLLAFFSNLKSIVTSYATYVVDSAVDVLKTTPTESAEEGELWRKALQVLTQCFEHDQDEFWQAPAHFGAIAPVLISQFAHAPSVDLTKDLIPAIVELAATADSQEHQKELNSTLLKNLRSEQAPVRLAVVKCQQALTDRLGEEWLSMLPEMLPYISELQEDDDEDVERETNRWIVGIETVLGESLDAMLQ
ncbi:putative BP28CT domain-containing protein [Rosellinia necatrix]|uniref:U3 small nucleolar RNA-associated protein 10 n=1 Tax=Rosellinia necatrix TaxID=77044 RepID=A0A1W2TNT7_ROSNE|nr:putative BP28CT domain-containing protein [Rosellinia necatrix]